MAFEELAAATVQVICGPGRGSGFRLLDPSVVVTNQHVVEAGPNQARARLENGYEYPLTYLGGSPVGEHDFAVFHGALPAAAPLEPASPGVTRGQAVAFAGFPHGIEDLLVQTATVAGPFEDKGFYIDGSINGGNSGGPIADVETGSVVGVITQRRFMGGEPLDAMAAQAQGLAQHCQSLRGGGSVSIMGINFGEFADMLAQANLLIRDLLLANANAGLGMAFDIAHAAEECRKHL